jgi:hypothetical protein
MGSSGLAASSFDSISAGLVLGFGKLEIDVPAGRDMLLSHELVYVHASRPVADRADIACDHRIASARRCRSEPSTQFIQVLVPDFEETAS